MVLWWNEAQIMVVNTMDGKEEGEIVGDMREHNIADPQENRDDDMIHHGKDAIRVEETSNENMMGEGKKIFDREDATKVSEIDDDKNIDSTTDDPEDNADDDDPRGKWRPYILLGGILIILIISQVFGLEKIFDGIQDWIDSLGPWGPVVYILIYMLAVIFAFPATPLTLAAGVLFGVVFGVILVSIASTAGASISFLMGRYYARDATEKALGKNEMFLRLEMMAEEHGAIIVALVRLVPLFPFNLVNYGFGLTKIPFKTFVFWSWLCMLPFTIIFVAGVDILVSLSHGDVPWGLIIFVGLMGGLLTGVTRHARKLLEEKEKECIEKTGKPIC